MYRTEYMPKIDIAFRIISDFYKNILDIRYLLGIGIVIAQSFQNGNMKKPFLFKNQQYIKIPYRYFQGEILLMYKWYSKNINLNQVLWSILTGIDGLSLLTNIFDNKSCKSRTIVFIGQRKPKSTAFIIKIAYHDNIYFMNEWYTEGNYLYNEYLWLPSWQSS